MEQADSLSRRIDWAEGVKRDNKNQVILKKKRLEIRVMEKKQLLVEEAKEEIIKKIKKLEARDDKVVKVVKKIKKAEVKVLRNDKQQIEDELVLKKEKIYVLKNKSLMLEIIDYSASSQYINSRIWKIVEDNRTNYQELLIGRSY